MSQRELLKKSSKQLSYRELQILVAARKEQCHQDKQRITAKIKDTQTVIKHQLTRPSSLGSAFFAGFTVDTVTSIGSVKTAKASDILCRKRSIIPDKFSGLVLTALIKELLSGS